MLNCYPEYKILYTMELLLSLKSNSPLDLLNDLSNWLRYPSDPSSISGLLNDYGIAGKHIPNWVKNSAIAVINGDIDKTEFAHMIQYLPDKNMLN